FVPLSELVALRAHTEQFALVADASQNPSAEIESTARELKFAFSQLMTYLAPSLAGPPVARALYVHGIGNGEAERVAALRVELVNRFNQAYQPWRKRQSLSAEAASQEKRLKTIQALMEDIVRQAEEVESLKSNERRVYDLNGRTYTSYNLEDLKS